MDFQLLLNGLILRRQRLTSELLRPAEVLEAASEPVQSEELELLELEAAWPVALDSALE